jgi:hypothetical protein
LGETDGWTELLDNALGRRSIEKLERRKKEKEEGGCFS